MMPMNVPPPPPPPLPAGTSEASASIVLDFQQALDLLSVNDSFAQAEQVVAAHENLEALRAQISQVSRQNFILERELGEIDQKIGLLIQNRITAQEVVNSSASLTNAATTRDVLAISRTYYENLLFLLQSQPHYLSVLIRLCDVKQAASLVQTVIFDLFGDQYDPRQERLLLSMFTHLLRSEFDACIDMGSFLRANSCTTQMLSAYARRGHGTTILRNTLADNLQAICSRKDFNLEINPLKVYQDYVQDTETKTGQKCTLPPCETAEQASQLPEIAAICAARLSQLLQCCSELLTRIVDGVESIPYGMRYIAKQLLTLGKVRFPDAGRKELDSLVGGYIYLRYFNPVIVTPDGLGFIRDKPSKIMRRNLILIAKVLQNLSNGLLFGEKEEFMVQCNGFIQANASRLSEYWKDLVKVDLDHELGAEGSSSSVDRPVSISINQLYTLHNLCVEHINELCQDSRDPLKRVVTLLGSSVPAAVSNSENVSVSLKLATPDGIDTPANRRRSVYTTSHLFTKTPFQLAMSDLQSDPAIFSQYSDPSRDSLKTLIQAVSALSSYRAELDCSNMMAFLRTGEALAHSVGDAKAAYAAYAARAYLNFDYETALLPECNSLDEAATAFAIQCAHEVASREERWEVLNKRMIMVSAAAAAIQQHHDYLISRLDLYNVYLQNARQGQAQVVSSSSAASMKARRTEPLKLKHKDLEQMGMIASVDADIDKSDLKSISYIFTPFDGGRCKVEVFYTKLISISVLSEPIFLQLEDLLKMQQSGETKLQMERVWLNVNLLIHFLNTNFVAPSK